MLDTGKFNELYGKVIEAGKAPPKSADLVYLVGQTRWNESSVLDAAEWFTGVVGVTGHDDTEESCGYPGLSHWRDELVRRGISADRIVGIEGSLVDVGGRQIVHTLSELKAMVLWAAREGVRDVVLVSTYWHMPRSFISAVTAAKAYYPRLRIYPALGAPLPWEEESVHSQGKTRGIRADFIFQETNRIFAYTAKGDLLPPEEVLPFLN